MAFSFTPRSSSSISSGGGRAAAGWAAAGWAAAGWPAAGTAAGTAAGARVAVGAATGSVHAVAVRDVGSVQAVAVRDGCAGSVLPVAVGVACPCSSSFRDRKFSTMLLLDKISAAAESSAGSFDLRLDFRRARGEEPAACTPAPAFGGSAGSVLDSAVPVACPCSAGCSLTRAPSSSLIASCLGLGVLGLESAIGGATLATAPLLHERPNLPNRASRWGHTEPLPFGIMRLSDPPAGRRALTATGRDVGGKLRDEVKLATSGHDASRSQAF